MKKKEWNPDNPNNLRERAEHKMGAAGYIVAEVLSSEQLARALHELQVHQTELEMQNEELRRVQEELEASRARYFDLYDLAPVGYCTIGKENLILEANLTLADLLGETISALVKQPFSRFILPEDQDIYYTFCRQLPKNGVSHLCELRLIKKNKTLLWGRLEASPNRGKPDCPNVFRVVISDITERRRLEDARKFLLECGLPGSNENFFESLAHYLARQLSMDYVCIDRLSGDNLSARTVAVYNNGNFDANIDYTLKDTPCSDAVGKSICCFPRNVRQLYPKDAALRELNAESYIGTTLWSSDGKPIGLIAVIGKMPLTNTEFAESLLMLAASRATGELERDLADEKINEIALFAEQNPSPVMRIDLTGILVYGNPASMECQQEWGLKVGMRIMPEWIDMIHRCNEDQKVFIEELPVGNKVYRFTFTPLSHLKYVNVYAFDITGLKRAEEALRKLSDGLEIQVQERTNDLQKAMTKLTVEQQRFNTVLEMLPAYIVLLTPDCRVKFANKFFRERFGDVKGKRRFVFLSGRGEPCETFKPMTTGEPHHWERIGSDNRHYDIYDFPFTDVDGSPLILEMGIDITDRKQAETALIDSNELKLLGQLTVGVAHEVRNPLNGILAIMGALSKELNNNDCFEPYMKHMRNQVTRLSVLMEDLLCLGKPLHQADLHEISLTTLVEKNLATWQQTLPSSTSSVRFIKPEATELCMINADTTSISQVIINLLENAVNHSPAGGEITCSIDEQKKEKVVFSIKDRGTGIPEGILPRIFEPFFTTRKGGTGLGLSIVNHIVENHQGTITASNNTDGPGATFEVELPRCVKQPSA